ncbi:hypothetical protein J4H92_09090 [Leucobacter weissii]|uniref:CARDB domain-containing protein n=1 Tax=Leucobacter weissii TaxID=1983706 RepID=A0A939MLH0_9MICO|nr:hypothetical protein [Leucobacter weissii]MBO1902100.1 hypothetical protein [Leucobacter weissii]
MAFGLSLLLVGEGAAIAHAQALAAEPPAASGAQGAVSWDLAPESFSAAEAQASSSSSGKTLVKQTARLGSANRVSGMPTTSDPGQQIARATVTVEIYGTGSSTTYFPEAEVELAGYPESTAVRLDFGVGRQQGTACNVTAWLGARTTSGGSRSYTLTGGYNPDYFARPGQPWNCVVVRARPLSSENPVDALVGGFSNTYHSPKLSVTQIRYLGKKVSRLPLVRSSRTRIEITVRNTGKSAARNVVLTGSGKSVKLSRVKAGTVAAGRSKTITATVRLSGKRKSSTLTVQAKGTGTTAKKRIKVRAAAKPAKPRSGAYRSSDKSVTFRVKKGRITQFRVRVQTRCGVAPDPYRYTQNTYDFPRKKIPRNGIVDARASGKNWGTGLRVKISGKRATAGLFNYSGPAACSATKAFTAKRIGR